MGPAAGELRHCAGYGHRPQATTGTELLTPDPVVAGGPGVAKPRAARPGSPRPGGQVWVGGQHCLPPDRPPPPSSAEPHFSAASYKLADSSSA
jgi:hypothetical protein